MSDFPPNAAVVSFQVQFACEKNTTKAPWYIHRKSQIPRHPVTTHPHTQALSPPPPPPPPPPVLPTVHSPSALKSLLSPHRVSLHHTLTFPAYSPIRPFTFNPPPGGAFFPYLILLILLLLLPTSSPTHPLTILPIVSVCTFPTI